MDFSAILTTLWNKVSKPTPNILLGAVFLVLAPSEVRWFGYIFLAIGIASILEFLWSKFLSLVLYEKRKILLRSSALSLAPTEKAVIKEMLLKNQHTFSVDYNDYHRVYDEPPLGSRHDYVKVFGACQDLQRKGFFEVSSLPEITSWTFKPLAWKVLMKIYKNNPTVFN